MNDNQNKIYEDKYTIKKILKRKKRLEKALSRAKFQQNHKFVVYMLRFFVISIIVLLSHKALKTSIELKDNYTNTEKWEKVSNVQISSLDTETLYATDEDKSKREHYHELLDKIWDSERHTFKANVSKEMIDELRQTYDSITSSKSSMQKTFDEVNDMWSVKLKIDDLFIDGSSSHQIIKKDVSREKLISIINESYDLISKYLIDDKNTLAHLYYVELSTISDDLMKMSDIIEQLNDNFSYSKSNKMLTLKTSMTRQNYVLLKSKIDLLSYKWKMIDDIVNPLMNKLDKVVALNDADESSYASFTSDELNKSEFNDFTKLYKDQFSNLQNSIVDLKNYVGKKKEDVEKELKELSLKYEFTYQFTTDQSKDDVIMYQDVDSDRYKKIKKNSKIKFIVYRFDQTQSSTSSSITNSHNDSINSTQTSTTLNSSTSTSTSSNSEPAAEIE